MDPKRFDWLLDSLAKAERMLPDPADRAAAQRLAEAFRDPERYKGSDAVRIVIVTGPEADPIGWELEAVGLNLTEARDQISTIADHVETLLDEFRHRRTRITAERDSLRADVKAFLDSVEVDLPNQPYPTQGWLEEELLPLRSAVRTQAEEAQP